MLEFPKIAQDLDKSQLIWKAVAHDPDDLTKESFLKELNRQLDNALSKREERFHVLTSISIANHVQLGNMTVEKVHLNHCGPEYPRKFRKARADAIANARIPASESPPTYTRVVATVVAKEASMAQAAARRAVDIERALWCLFCNSQMEIFGQSWAPINAIRSGAVHTTHQATGEIAGGAVWFEPYHPEGVAYTPSDAASIKRRVQGILARLKNSNYTTDIVDAMLLYVRALDEWNQNTAFTRLWSAVERLASPGRGNYDAVVRRCAFLWEEPEYMAQTLEHLRDYRNCYMHTGTEMPEAKAYCFQLQQQFLALLRFHIGNSNFFRSLDEANQFLDLPTDLAHRRKMRAHLSKADRFRTPQETKPRTEPP